MRKLFLQILIGIVGLGLSIWILKIDFDFQNNYSTLILAGTSLGVFNVFVKPILKILTIPLRVLTLGLFSLFLNMAILWSVDVLVLGKIFILADLFWATLIIWISNLIFLKHE